MTGIWDQIDLAAWEHEARGPHGEWIKGTEDIVKRAYELPDPKRLAAKGPFPMPGDHPFFKKHPVSPHNIVATWDQASPQQREQGMRWYQDAHDLATAIGKTWLDGDTTKAAGLLAAFSPRTAWPINMFNAARVAKTGTTQGFRGQATGDFLANAQEALDGMGIDANMPSPKINSFAHLIDLGHDHPDDKIGEVVVDRHALDVATGAALTDKEGGDAPIGKERYHEYVADQFRQAARLLSEREGHTITPYQVQAVTWLVRQQEAQAADLAAAEAGKLTPADTRLIRGRITRTRNAWTEWMAYARDNNIPVEATTAKTLTQQYWQSLWEFSITDQIELAFNPLQPRDAHGRWTKVGEAVDSLAKHTLPTGEITPERSALHRQIVEGILAGHQPQAHPVATFFGGGSASGKSSLHAATDDNAKIDADEIKTQLPEYQQMTAAGDTRAAAYAHEESSLVAKQAQKEAERRRINYILDGTGNSSYDKMVSKVTGARAAGYGANAHYVTVDTDEAVRRAMKRAARTGRMVPETVIRGIHSSVTSVFRKAAENGLFDRAELLDNNGTSARLIARREPGRTFEVLDPAAWRRFLDKETEDATGRDSGGLPASPARGGGLPAGGSGRQPGGQAGVGLSGERPGPDAIWSQAGRSLGLQPGTVTSQLDLASDAWLHELRGPHGEWVKSLNPHEVIQSVYERLMGAYDGEKDKQTQHLIQTAGAAYDNGDLDGASHWMHEASLEADSIGNGDAAKDYQKLSDDLHTAAVAVGVSGNNIGEVRKTVSKMAHQTALKVPKLLGGGQEIWNGRLSLFGAAQKPAVGAEIDWNGGINFQAGLARKMDTVLSQGKSKPLDMSDMQPFVTLLHELIHGTIEPGQDYTEHEEAYQDQDQAAIEEGFTELGTIQHAASYFKAAGIGSRGTSFTSGESNPDYPVKLAALESKLRAEAEAIRQRRSAPAEPGRVADLAQLDRAARAMDEAVSAVQFEDLDTANDSIDLLQHLGDPVFTKDAAKLRAALTEAKSTPIALRITAALYADRLNDPSRIASSDAWGHYGWQTAQALHWCQGVADAEGFADRSKGTPGYARVTALADEINRFGDADKVMVMAEQAARAAGAGAKGLSPGPAGELARHTPGVMFEADWAKLEETIKKDWQTSGGSVAFTRAAKNARVARQAAERTAAR